MKLHHVVFGRYLVNVLQGHDYRMRYGFNDIDDARKVFENLKRSMEEGERLTFVDVDNLELVDYAEKLRKELE
jgi:hypothetical protein